MTIQQINAFREKAKAMGKSDFEIDTFINRKLQQEPQTAFSPRPVQPQSSGFQSRQTPIAESPSNPFQVSKEVGKGFLKGVGSTLLNMGKTGVKALEGITGLKDSIDPDVDQVFTEAVKPTNTAQKIGFYGEQVSEFFIPTTAVGKLNKAVDIAGDGLKVGSALKAGAKVFGRAATEAGTAATVRFAQTGDTKQAVTAGATAGVVSGGLNAVGQALKSARIPEWFYSKVFKTSYDDMLSELKTLGTANLKNTNPGLYNELTSSGVIKLKEGKVVLNETLAKEALDRGLKGSIKNMASEVVKNTYELERAAQVLTKSHAGVIKIEPQYLRLLKEVADDYQSVGFGEVSKEAADLLALIQKGSATAEDALRLRRFLDGMRVRASFNPTAKLSQTQQNFKYLADTLRKRLSTEVPGLKPVMNEYRFNIEALEALAKEAARRNNREALGLLDTVLFGSGVAGGAPIASATIGTARKILTTPSAVTRIGSKLQKGLSPKTKSAVRAASSIVPNAIRDNLQRQRRVRE